MFGWDFEDDAWSRFWRWNLIKICVWTCNMNSTLGSVVPLAMFYILTDFLYSTAKCQRGHQVVSWRAQLMPKICTSGASVDYHLTDKSHSTIHFVPAGGIAWVECMYRHRCIDDRFEDLVQWTIDQSRSGSLSKLLAELVTAECETFFFQKSNCTRTA